MHEPVVCTCTTLMFKRAWNGWRCSPMSFYPLLLDITGKHLEYNVLWHSGWGLAPMSPSTLCAVGCLGMFWGGLCLGGV